MGRPTKLTEELLDKFVKLTKIGVPLETVREACEIGETTYRDWMRRGQADGEDLYAEFSRAVTRAYAEAEIALAVQVRKGDAKGISNGPARGAAWLLERTRGKRYAARVNVKVEQELESLLDVVERVCGEKGCGCLEAIFEAIAAHARGEEVGEAAGSEEPDCPVVN